MINEQTFGAINAGKNFRKSQDFRNLCAQIQMHPRQIPDIVEQTFLAGYKQRQAGEEDIWQLIESLEKQNENLQHQIVKLKSKRITQKIRRFLWKFFHSKWRERN